MVVWFVTAPHDSDRGPIVYADMDTAVFVAEKLANATRRAYMVTCMEPATDGGPSDFGIVRPTW